MARPREFDEQAVLDSVVGCFWSRGFEATTMRDLIDSTGLSGASLYNAFGDKRALFRVALDHFIVETIGERIDRCDVMCPREAIQTFFDEVVTRSLEDRRHRGCMLVNSALEVAPHDANVQRIVATALRNIEDFFLRSVRAGQADGSINRAVQPEVLAAHLLAILMGLRVLARVRPEPALLANLLKPSLDLLEPRHC